MPTLDIRSAEQWSAAIAAEIVPLTVRTVSTGFRAVLDRRDLGPDFRVTRVTSNANSVQRSIRDITSMDDGYALFHVNLRGTLKVVQHGRMCELSGPSAVLYTTERPSSFEFSDGYECLVLQFPRDALPLTPRELQRVVVRRASDDPLLRLLMQLVGSGVDLLGQESRADRKVVGAAALEFVAAILRAHSSDALTPHRRLFVQMQAHIDRNFADKEYDVTALAKAFHVSPRVVYRVFAAEGLHPGASIRKARLGRARELLNDTTTTVHEIAYLVGFADPSTFARAFRRSFGTSPADWRSCRSA